jgi:hypothetical protein
MEAPLTMYRRIVAEQPPLEDPWFETTLARWRCGDEPARRAIQGSCLSRILATVEGRYGGQDDDELLQLVEDANGALDRVIEEFHGTTAAEFREYLDQTVARQLEALSTEGT